MLTEEQRERIRLNRERALEIKRKRAEEQTEEVKRQKATENNCGSEAPKSAEVSVILESFEEGASETVTKTEAMKMYCLPQGTLAVCKFESKVNPRHPSWTPMKLYYRSEIRSRARERYGGLQGLQEERNRREEKRFKDDLERTKNIFKTNSK